MELYRKYRPTTLDDVVGQDDVIRDLKARAKKKTIPHAILLHGPSGTGKSTIAYILGDLLGCVGTDYIYKNCALVENPLDTIREIKERFPYPGINGGTRCYCLDELQAFMRATYAQQALLDMTENPPNHVYFFLCTTDPDKVHKAIKTRCTKYALSPLKDKAMRLVLDRVLEAEKCDPISDDVIEKLIRVAAGSAREALVLLEKVLTAETEEEQLDAITNSEQEHQGIELARALINPRVQWQEVAKILKNLNEEPEKTRSIVLSYANSVMLGGGKLSSRAYEILVAFEEPYIYTRQSNLTRACYDVVLAK